MTQWIDDDGQEYGFDTHDMHLFADEALTMELSIDSISKKALAEIIGGEPIIRCKDCKYWDGYFCHNKWWGDGYGNYTPPIKDEDGFCDWAERKEE